MTAFQLKLLAGLCMLVDHAAVVFLEAPLFSAGYELFGNMLLDTPLRVPGLWYAAMRLIGRLAFPIYAFQLAEGTQRTKNPGRYLMRLGVFALLSELPFDLALHGGAFTWSAQNIYWTLGLGAGAVMLYQRESQPRILAWAWPAAAALLAEGMQADYGWYGVVVIFLFYLTLGNRQQRTALLVVPLALQATAPLALLPINSYHGEQGPRVRWAFYLFYPAHLLVLYGIWLLMQ